MSFLAARSIAPAARAWMRHASGARVLHAFERACNLINADGDVLSLVALEAGDGPFTVVVPLADSLALSDLLDTDSPIAVDGDRLSAGALVVDTATAVLWSPRPRWERAREPLTSHGDLVSALADLLASNPGLTGLTPLSPQSIEDLCAGVATGDASSCRSAARRLAGLGGGLTPAGDDFLVGAMHAAWLAHPPREAALLSEVIASAAAPLTTSLSAAWLRAAARGEAAAPWHALVEALAACDETALLAAARRILSIGHTSGADALAGCVAALAASRLDEARRVAQTML